MLTKYLKLILIAEDIFLFIREIYNSLSSKYLYRYIINYTVLHQKFTFRNSQANKGSNEIEA